MEDIACERQSEIRSSGCLKQNNELKPLTIVFSGCPDSGKSELIKAIAGTRLQVDKWPEGVLERQTALLDCEGKKMLLVALPDTDSLGHNSQEEIIARNYLVREKPDVIVNVIEASNLERDLYFTVQLFEIGIPVVIALNMCREGDKKGCKINIAMMCAILGIPVIETDVFTKKGLNILLRAALAIKESKANRWPKVFNYGEYIDLVALEIRKYLIKKDPLPFLNRKYPLRWLVYKIIEGDAMVTSEIGLTLDMLSSPVITQLKKTHGDELQSLMAEARFAQAAGLTKEILGKI